MSDDDFVLVRMHKDDVKFLQELAQEMRTQDRAATADPYFYVIQRTTNLPAPEGYGERSVRVDWSGDPTVYRNKEDFFEYVKERQNQDDPIIDEQLEKEWDRLDVYGEHDVIVEDNVFLTKKGYLEHVELNGHNLREHQVYIKHAWRNPEMDNLIKIIKKF